MSIESLVGNAQIFLILLVRIVAFIQIAPLISSSAIPQVAKIGLSFFTAAAVLPWVVSSGVYIIPNDGLSYVFLLLGEILIGITMGFFLVVLYASFQLAGQFFSMQMGFAASQVFDPLAQIQIPLMGQYINLIAMFVFLTVSGFQKIFLLGIYNSFKAITAYDFLAGKDSVYEIMIGGIGKLFEQALIIALPIMGTLLLVSVTMGLLAKAAPQMNLLMLGFPINISVAFIILFLSLPFLMKTFSKVIDYSFLEIIRLFGNLSGGG